MQWHLVAKGKQCNSVTKQIYLELSLQILTGGWGQQLDEGIKVGDTAGR